MKPTFPPVNPDQIDPNLLKPHPRNYQIYGDEDVSELAELIRSCGWIKTLVVTANNTIISGHRRWKATLALGLESVPVEVQEFPDETAELEALLLENASRFKNTEQKVREAEAWKEVERIKAKNRQGTRTDIQENFPGCDSGQVRDQVARRVGLGSGRTYEKAAAVVREIDALLLDTPQTAMAFKKVLNEHSVDAAHRLLKKPDPQRKLILSLIASGEAKSTKQAERMVKQNNYPEFNDPSQATCAGFSVGDWVEVNKTTVTFKPYIGQRGQVEQILAAEQQISVNLEDGPSKIRFYPHELTLVAKAPPPCPFQASDLVIVDIDRHEAVSPQEKKWNRCWGKVTQISDTGSVTVDVGKETLQLFPRDLKPMDAPSSTLRDVIERVLRLRGFELDEIEKGILDVIQRQEWFTPRQLDYLDFMEKFYLQADLYELEKSQVARCKRFDSPLRN